MNKIVNLKDYKEEALELSIKTNNQRPIDSGYHYPTENIEKAIEELCNANLKYNIKSGKTYISNEVVSEYCFKNDIPKYEDGNEIEVVEAQFICNIMNSAGRLTRGHSAI